MARKLSPIHPGEVLREDVLRPLEMSVEQLAATLSVGAARVNGIVRGRRESAPIRRCVLARYLGTTAEFWINLQKDYELRVAREAKQKEIERAVRPRSEAA